MPFAACSYLYQRLNNGKQGVKARCSANERTDARVEVSMCSQRMFLFLVLCSLIDALPNKMNLAIEFDLLFWKILASPLCLDTEAT